jgi:hypothetical protein
MAVRNWPSLASPSGRLVVANHKARLLSASILMRGWRIPAYIPDRTGTIFRALKKVKPINIAHFLHSGVQRAPLRHLSPLRRLRVWAKMGGQIMTERRTEKIHPVGVKEPVQ